MGTVTVDIHCHISTPECDDLVRPLFTPEKDPFVYYSGPASEAYNRSHFAEIVPKLTLPKQRLRDMDKMGIDIQAISVAPPQYFYWTEPDVGVKLATMQNDNLARIVASHPDRFVGLGTVPLQDVPASLDELNRIVDDLGFHGIEICSNVNGVDFDDPRFIPFFERVSELNLFTLVHPNGFTQGERLSVYYLINTIGMPLDSAIFLARVIFGGVFEQFPNLKICVAHGGGYLPSYPARYDHAWRVRADVHDSIPQTPSSYLRKVYFDTVVYEGYELSKLVDRYGADHILLGTDYPYDMGETDPVGLVGSLVGLSDDERRMVLGGNAARLLRLNV